MDNSSGEDVGVEFAVVVCSDGESCGDSGDEQLCSTPIGIKQTIHTSSSKCCESFADDGGDGGGAGDTVGGI